MSSRKFDIRLKSLRCIALHSVEGVTLAMRQRTWYLSCFRRTYLALLKAVLVTKVDELDTRAATMDAPVDVGEDARRRTDSYDRPWEVLSSTRSRLSACRSFDDDDDAAALPSLPSSSSPPSSSPSSFSPLPLPTPTTPSRSSSKSGSRSSPSSSGTSLSFPTSNTVPYDNPIRQ